MAISDKIFISARASEIIDELKTRMKDICNGPLLARISISLGVNEYGTNIDNFDPLSVNKYNGHSTFTQEELQFYTILFSSLFNRSVEYSELLNYIGIYITLGADILKKIYDSSSDNGEFMLKLVELTGDTPLDDFDQNGNFDFKNGEVNPLKILLGKSVDDDKNIELELNLTSKHPNSHLAIMGTTGAGKTQILLNILAQIREQSDFKTNFIFLDYKGEDILYKKEFENIIKPYGSYVPPKVSIPINPFILSSYDRNDIKMSAQEKEDSFASALKGVNFGTVQKNTLYEIILSCYKKREGLDIPYPDFNDLYEETKVYYKENGKNPDSLREIVKNLSEFNLFSSRLDGDQILSTIHDKTFIVGLSKVNSESLKSLMAYSVIEKLYREMQDLPNTEVVNGFTQIRTVLVIDEAHHYLSQKNAFLQKIIREGRSKGIVVFFASQSPNDYEQDDFNYRELLEFGIVLKCKEQKVQSVEKLLGCSRSDAQNLTMKIGEFEQYEGVIRDPSSEKGYTIFKGEPFWKRYLEK